MKQTAVQKLAWVLRVLVVITFVCNLIALYFVPALAALAAGNRWDGQITERLLSGPLRSWLDFSFYAWNPLLWMMGAASGDLYFPVLALFLLFSGVCSAVILWQGKRMLDTILKGTPFTLDNSKNLRRAAVFCFLISGAALLRLIWGFAAYESIAPLLTYNALFVPVFLMAGLLCMVMSALFRQAAELKAENDLTI